ncbi:MAG: hypothetical protein NDJ89_06780 [Oligoflexia bacterium]|nr:hypothetical protein [Oligoflexia bacterium]
MESPVDDSSRETQKNSKWNSSGFSLLEVLVAGSLMIFMAMAGASAIQNQAASIGYLEDRLSRTELEKEVGFLVTTKESCENSLNGTQVISGAHNVSLRDRNNAVRFSPTGSTATYDKLKIASIQLVDKNIGAANSAGVAEVVMSVSRTRKGGGPSGPFELRVPVLVATDAGGRVSGCGTPTSTIGDLCVCSGYPATGCGCCAAGKTWNILGSWDQEDRHGVHRACVTCPPQANTTDWMIFLCVAG